MEGYSGSCADFPEVLFYSRTFLGKLWEADALLTLQEGESDRKGRLSGPRGPNWA